MLRSTMELIGKSGEPLLARGRSFFRKIYAGGHHKSARNHDIDIPPRRDLYNRKNFLSEILLKVVTRKPLCLLEIDAPGGSKCPRGIILQETSDPPGIASAEYGSFDPQLAERSLPVSQPRPLIGMA